MTISEGIKAEKVNTGFDLVEIQKEYEKAKLKGILPVEKSATHRALVGFGAGTDILTRSILGLEKSATHRALVGFGAGTDILTAKYLKKQSEYGRRLKFHGELVNAYKNIYPRMSIKNIVILSFPVFEYYKERYILAKKIVKLIERGVIDVAFYPKEVTQANERFFLSLDFKIQIETIINIEKFINIISSSCFFVKDDFSELGEVWREIEREYLSIEGTASKKSKKKTSTNSKYVFWQDEVNKEFNKKKEQFHYDVCRRLSRKLGVCVGTLRRRTKKPTEIINS